MLEARVRTKRVIGVLMCVYIGLLILLDVDTKPIQGLAEHSIGKA